jgi:hypothetical protein
LTLAYNYSCGSDFIESRSRYGSKSSIRIQIQHPDPDPDPGIDDQKLKKKIQLKICLKSFFSSKIAFTYISASIQDVQATGKAFIPQKKTSST